MVKNLGLWREIGPTADRFHLTLLNGPALPQSSSEQREWRVCLHRQRKRRTASRKLTTIHATMIAMSGVSTCQPAPRRMLARRTSTTAVSGSAWMNGCNGSGKREAEKKTPEKIHIGSMTRFMRPDAPSIVWTRDDTSRPREVKASDEMTQMPASVSSDPRNGTPNTSAPNPSSRPTSITSSVSLERTNEARY